MRKCDCGGSVILGSLCADCAATALIDQIGIDKSDAVHERFAKALTDLGGCDEDELATRCVMENIDESNGYVRLISAVKMYRQLGHVSLSEAKNIVEEKAIDLGKKRPRQW